MNQTFAPLLLLLIGILLGGLGCTFVFTFRRRASHSQALDSTLPPLQVRLIDRIEPLPSQERKWYTDQLTPREMEIALLAAKGERTADIARTLVISPLTVETHIKNIYRKLEVSSRVELAHALADLGTGDQSSI